MPLVSSAGLDWVAGLDWLAELDRAKGGGAIACYYGLNYLGSFLKIITDPCLIHATVSFIFFLLTLDFLYDFEEVIELCEAPGTGS